MKDAFNEAANNLDTTNRIIEETVAIQEQIKETVTNAATQVVTKAANVVAGFGKWLIKMGSKP